jgi:hypothetical protein
MRSSLVLMMLVISNGFFSLANTSSSKIKKPVGGKITSTSAQNNQSKAISNVAVAGSVNSPQQRPTKGLKVQFTFDSVKTDLRLKLYRLPIERAPDAGETQVVPRSAPIDAQYPIIDGIFVRKGGIQPFLMVVDNPSNEPKYFFATTHTVTPEEAGVGFGLNCLCNNHYFEVPPQSRWERVGVIKLEQHAVGTQIRFVHKLIGLTKEQIVEKGLNRNAN